MNCSRDLIEAYLDRELDPGITAAMEDHFSNCPACSETRARLSAQRENIRRSAPYYAAPAQLERSIRNALRQAAHDIKPAGKKSPWRWLAIAAMVLLAISIAWNLRPPGAPNRGKRPDRAEHPLRSHPLFDRNAPAGRALLRSAHGKAMVQWQARLFTGSEGFRSARVPTHRRPPRLFDRQARGRAGVRQTATCHQRLYLACRFGRCFHGQR